MLARCRDCSALFEIGGGVVREEQRSAATRRRPPVAMPVNIRVLVDGTAASRAYRSNAQAPHVVVERRWGGPLSLTWLTALWWAGGAFLYTSAWRQGGTALVLSSVGHAAAGVLLTYVTACHFVNATRIGVADGVLSVRHGPLPWRRALAVPAADLDQLFCREDTTEDSPNTYSLHARLKSGGQIALLEGLPEADQALYVEQLLEDRLGIVDVAVAGEHT